jgi:IS605 OrfB family transposase
MNEDHCISKALVSLAEGTKRALALEELTHIRSRTTVRKADRDAWSKWAFKQLRSFIEYKSKLSAAPLVLVGPEYTSQQCSACGHIDEGNRRSRSFVCLRCGHAEHADVNASKNIRGAAISQPMVVRHVMA